MNIVSADQLTTKGQVMFGKKQILLIGLIWGMGVLGLPSFRLYGCSNHLQRYPFLPCFGTFIKGVHAAVTVKDCLYDILLLGSV